MNIIMAASKAKIGKKCGKTRHTKSKELAMRNMFWMNISRVIGTRTSTVIKIMPELKRKLNLTYNKKVWELPYLTKVLMYMMYPFCTLYSYLPNSQTIHN